MCYMFFFSEINIGYFLFFYEFVTKMDKNNNK